MSPAEAIRPVIDDNIGLSGSVRREGGAGQNLHGPFELEEKRRGDI